MNKTTMRLATIASALLCANALAADWTYDGSTLMTSGDWSIKVSKSNAANHELTTVSWQSCVASGSGDLDLSGDILDGSGQKWSLVSIGPGAFNPGYLKTDLTSLTMPRTLRSIGAWSLDGNATLTNLVIDCPNLTEIGANALRIDTLQHLTLAAPRLASWPSEVASRFTQCSTELATLNLDSLETINSHVPRRFNDSGVLRLPSLKTLGGYISLSGGDGMRGLILGGAEEDGSSLEQVSTYNLVTNCPALEYIVIGYGANLKIDGWNTFSMKGCPNMKRIFFACPQPTYAGGNHYDGLNRNYSLCFYIRPNDSSWSDFIASMSKPTSSEITKFREVFGYGEPEPFGVANYGNSGMQFFSYGDYRSFVGDVFMRTDNPDGLITELSPMRIETDGPEEGAPRTYSITDKTILSADGKVRYGYFGYTLETYGENGWTGGSVTNYGQSVTLTADGTASRRITWLYDVVSYRVSFTDRGFLEEYPESFAVTYPDGAPDADGFITRGNRVTLAVTGFETTGDHPGSFVAWEGENADVLAGQGAETTFTVDRPMSVHPHTTHAWTYTPKASSVSDNDEISDGNWRVVVTLKGNNLAINGTTGWGWSSSYLAGSGFLDVPETATAADGSVYTVSGTINAQTFTGSMALRGLRTHAGITGFGYEAFAYETSLAVVEFAPNSIKTIDKGAFRGTGLTSLELIQTNLVQINANAFSGTQIANLQLVIPNVKSINAVFGALPLDCDVSSWNLSSVTSLDYYACIGSESIEQKVTGTLRLPSVETVSQISLPKTLTGIDFDRAVPTSVSPNWCTWGRCGLKQVIFRGEAPSRTVLDNLLQRTGDKQVTIRCSRKQEGWLQLVDRQLTTDEETAAAALRATLAEDEKLLGVYVTAAGNRRAWVVNKPSPYDAARKFYILVR